jgi:hypothetical protein
MIERDAFRLLTADDLGVCRTRKCKIGCQCLEDEQSLSAVITKIKRIVLSALTLLLVLFCTQADVCGSGRESASWILTEGERT